MQNDSYFSFSGYAADFSKGTVQFHYELCAGGVTRKFIDTVLFDPNFPGGEAGTDPVVISALLQGMHLALGISYWKTYCPQDIRTPMYQLTAHQAQFWNTVYTKGLGEFFYTNSIDYRGLVQFPFAGIPIKRPPVIHRKPESLVMLGGGKDSIVTGEILKKNSSPFTLFTMNANEIHTKTAAIMEKKLINIRRIIDPSLFDVNGQPGIFNGHIPISSIFAFIGLFAAYIYDFSYLVASNEKSASYGNVMYLGSEINHQWSKSIEFERLFRTYVHENILDGIEYFSFLRPLTELSITRIFTEYPHYFPVFTSCNKVFRIVKNRPAGNWCGQCPKCAFVYLLLSSELPKKTLQEIFHKHMFEDESLIPLFEELCGLRGIKPFECVGTPGEAIEAFKRMRSQDGYGQDAVVRALLPTLERSPEFLHANDGVTLSEDHCIPENYFSFIKDYVHT